MPELQPTFEDYKRQHEEPRFTNWLKNRSQPDWEATVTHPFVLELGSGSLSTTDFAEYLVQDYAFLEQLIGTFGFAVGEAPSIAEKRPLIEFLDTLTAEENDYFERSFDALSVPAERIDNPDSNDVTASFIDLLGRAAREGGYEETLAVLVPAEWIYCEWATSLTTEGTEIENDGGDRSNPGDLPFYYAEWIDLHAIPEFRSFVSWLRTQLDTNGPELHPERQQRIAFLFQRTVYLEKQFFDAVYSHT